jgi:hypothetical protein
MSLLLKPLAAYDDEVKSPEYYMAILAMESGHVANMITTFREMLPSFKNSIETAISSLNPYAVDAHEQFLCASVDFKELEKKLPHLNYLTVGQVMVSVPENISCSLLTLAETLDKMLPVMYKGALDILGDYNVFLASFITNKEVKISVKDYSDFYKGIKERREALVKELSVCYASQETRDVLRLKHVVDRMSDIPTIVNTCDKTSRLRHSLSLDRINKEVNKAVGLLNAIIRDTADIEKVSGVSATNLSNGAYEVAKYVEFMGMFYYKITDLNKSVAQIVASLNKNL